MLDWGGTAVAVGVPGFTDEVSFPAVNLVQVNRTIKGSRYGGSRPQHDIPLYAKWYQEGKLKLDELVTRTYPLADFDQVVTDMHDGKLAPGRARVLMPLPDWFHEAAARVNNWGRWGDDDQLGTLNLITPEVVTKAAGCVRTGKRFSLAWPLSFAENLQRGNIPGRNVLRTMTSIDEAMLGDRSLFCTSDDVVTMGLQAATHWDGLAHVSYDGRMYNGVSPSTVTAAGATQLGIHHVRSIVSRGVLLDVARTRGVERLDAGYGMTPEDLDAAVAAAGVTVESGDVVLVRTGQMSLVRGTPTGP